MRFRPSESAERPDVAVAARERNDLGMLSHETIQRPRGGDERRTVFDRELQYVPVEHSILGELLAERVERLDFGPVAERYQNGPQLRTGLLRRLRCLVEQK